MFLFNNVVPEINYRSEKSISAVREYKHFQWRHYNFSDVSYRVCIQGVEWTSYNGTLPFKPFKSNIWRLHILDQNALKPKQRNSQTWWCKHPWEFNVGLLTRNVLSVRITTLTVILGPYKDFSHKKNYQNMNKHVNVVNVWFYSSLMIFTLHTKIESVRIASCWTTKHCGIRNFSEP